MQKKLMVIAGAVLMAASSQADDLLIRPKNFIVTPSTGPVAEIIVKNTSDKAYNGKITPQFPERWEIEPQVQDVELKAGETKIVSFAIRKGFDVSANDYKVKVSADGQADVNATVHCATAAYLKPKIDGKLNEWGDAVPITFEKDGKKTTVRTHWNSSQFCLAVEVEEDALIGENGKAANKDAIQFAISPGGSVTPKSGEPAARYEYLAMDSGGFFKADSCFQLVNRGDNLTSDSKDLSPLKMDDAEVKVAHKDGVTTYELAIPIKPMFKALKVSAGREFCISLLVHDPDGTGVRDMGSVMNMWEESRNPNAWSNWNGVKWGSEKPFDNKIEHGFSSSVH